VGELGPFTITEPGVQRALEIIVRATLAVSAVSILISVTRATDLLGAIHHLPLPHLIKQSLALGYRYLYLLTDEFERTRRALRSRAGHTSLFRAWRGRAATLSHLFVRAHARGTRVHAAMLSRGYRSEMPTLAPAARVHPIWTATIVFSLAMIWVAGYLEVRG
jgi:cobalt/nickel transport system permease protein